MDASTRDVVGGRYRLEDRLARGGMGEVWRAHDTHTGRAVAVKLIYEGAGDSAGRRLRREARMVASLIHPNIVTVLDVVGDADADDGETGEGEHPAIVMELVEGETLADRLAREGPLPFEDALRVADGVLAALEAAHARDIVHRDVTPANVLLAGDGAVKVTDFGIARSPSQTRLTDTGTVVGTAPYLSPEQLLDEPLSPASDQYSAAVVIYEALTGSRPFEGDSPASVAVARLHAEPVPLRERRPEVPEAVSAVVARALSREAERRFATVSEMRVALQTAGAETGAWAVTRPMAAPPAPPAPPGGAAAATAPLGTTAVLDAPVPPSAGGAPRTPRSRARTVLLVVAVSALAALAGVALGEVTDGAGGTLPMPDLVGSDVDAARGLAERSGFALSVAEVADAAPEGTVVDQDIAPGTEVAEGTELVVEVSTGEPPCCTAPQVVGLPIEEAERAIEEAGLEVGEVDEVEAKIEDGTVLTQDPVGGTDTDPGGTVDLVVSGKGDDDKPGRGRGRSDD